MISIAHLYTDFSDFSHGPNAANAPADEMMHDAQLASFESGYQAGWEDAVKAKDEESESLTAEFVQKVQDISFTYHEAYNKLSAGMQPLMSRFVTTVLPAVAQEGLHFQLIDQIGKLMERQSENVVELVVSPERRAHVQQVLEDQAGIPFSVTEEPSLGDGQVYLRVNQHEREIDIDAVLSEVSSAVDAFFHTTAKELKHG